MRARVPMAIAGAAVLAAALAVPGVAQDGPAVEVVAEGLSNPRGVTVAPSGEIWVVEAGSAGDQCMEAGPMGEVCFGLTGAISRIADGSVERVVEGLPSAGFGAEVGGPSDIAFIDDSTFYVTANLGGDPAMREGMPPEMAGVAGWLLRGTTDGTIEPFVDIAAFESSDNPEPTLVDSNPYSVAVVDGSAVVADAGGNDLLMVDESGQVSLIAVFPPREIMFSMEQLQAMAAAGGPEGEAQLEEMVGEGEPPEMLPLPVEAVPTSVVVHEGDYYVGQLTGGPFPVGEARVFKVTPEGEVSEYATGFTNIIDIAFGPDGTLYVAEIVHAGLGAAFGGQPPIGAVLSVPPGGGEPTLLVSDERVMAPGGIAATEDALYVSVGNLVPEPGAGSLVRIPL